MMPATLTLETTSTAHNAALDKYTPKERLPKSHGVHIEISNARAQYLLSMSARYDADIALASSISALQCLLQQYGYGIRSGQLSNYAVYHQYARYFDQHLYDESTGRWAPSVGEVPGWAVLPMTPLL